ncbi:aspartate/glutamate racemase family protein [Ruegeria marina]|uniref:Aspartate racemase n=1 Tax=Ruegeria marina TaxID=639004 RepID=A0A1G7DR76_9RHOB|nr:amino acid racemase [Ruegeria marina]SDE53977.1 aspartate racemase [Ruegeria marina]
MAVPKTIGILGGMGPEATVLMMQRIIEATPAKCDQDHIPLLVDNNPQVPSRIDHLIHRTGEDPGPVLARMAQRLQDMGAEALAMPCNTAHRYAPVIEAGCDIPLINMVEAVADQIAGAMGPGARVGLLGSPALRLTGLFDAPMQARGLHMIYPQDDGKLLHLIQTIKAEGPTSQARASLTEIAGQMRDRGVDRLVTACTEFSLLFRDLDLPVPSFDSLDAVCKAVVGFALPQIPVRCAS